MSIIVLITHIDEYCAGIKGDVTKTFHHECVRLLVNRISLILRGLNPNQIFPVVNYRDELHLDENKDILLLYPLRTMVRGAQDYLEYMEKCV